MPFACEDMLSLMADKAGPGYDKEAARRQLLDGMAEGKDPAGHCSSVADKLRRGPTATPLPQ